MNRENPIFTSNCPGLVKWQTKHFAGVCKHTLPEVHLPVVLELEQFPDQVRDCSGFATELRMLEKGYYSK